MTCRETSGIIVSGGVAVTAVPASGDRLGLSYANNSVGPLNFSATDGQIASATVGVPVPAGQSFSFPANKTGDRGQVPTGAITVWGASANAAFYIAESRIT